MDFFDIQLVVQEDLEAPQCRYGEIRIGTFRERFQCDVSFWGPTKYDQQ